MICFPSRKFGNRQSTTGVASAYVIGKKANQFWICTAQ